MESFYQPLYRFAVSLTGNDSDAGDLVQQTFYLWATKGHQLREPAKAKTWLFTTLHRQFLNRRRHLVRFPHSELSEAEPELPAVEARAGEGIDSERLLTALQQLDESFRGPIALFFLEDYSYQEIAAALDLPLGTVKSRLSRGLSRLHRVLQDPQPVSSGGPNPPPS